MLLCRILTNYRHDIGYFEGITYETTSNHTNNPTNKTTSNPTNKSAGKQGVITLTEAALAVLREFQKDGAASSERIAKILKMTPDGNEKNTDDSFGMVMCTVCSVAVGRHGKGRQLHVDVSHQRRHGGDLQQ